MSKQVSPGSGPLAGDPALPGIEAPSAAVTSELARALAQKGPGYQPRTRHLAAGQPRYTNRLIRESSPYLLQHAHNPVNWFSWGDEAFERARQERKLVLLSVGYSTCHWCHVMEHESFEDEEIAATINRSLIPIKVDREERPDVDAVYMTTVQMMSGRGGWPMNVFLTPEREPIFGGTYFPPRDGVRGARVGFAGIVEELARRFAEDPDGIGAQARRFTEHLRAYLAPRAVAAVPGPEVLRGAVEQLADSYDPEFGGFAGAPKFPRPSSLLLLGRYWRRTRDEGARRMVEVTLERMAAGGIRDHVGGGFHRYSVDEWWLVPHFEKMLYDNAQLAMAYVEGWQLTGRADFAEIARETLHYLAREMRVPEGGFMSATDADSADEQGHLHEGIFFTWTPRELEDVLGPERAKLVASFYGVTGHGNFEGRTVLNVQKPVGTVAEGLGMSTAALREELSAARAELHLARSRRARPATDDKIITAWNALAVSAFARCGWALEDRGFIEVAELAARFLLERMRDGGRLRRVYMDGVARHEGFLDDYAYLVSALLDLYEATSGTTWLREAIALQGVLDADFWDEQGGGYFFTGRHHESLLARDKPDFDGAEPAGNSVAALNLLRLGELTSQPSFHDRAERALAAFGEDLGRRGLALPFMLTALDFLLDRPLEIVIVGPSSGEGIAELLAPLRTRLVPNRVLCVAREGDDLASQAALVPLAADKRAIGGQATAYVCRGQVCELPTRDPAELVQALERVEPLGGVAPLHVVGAETSATDWVYDTVRDRHWDPVHQHWHPGRPPAER